MISKNTVLVQICKVFYQYLENVASITDNGNGSATVAFNGQLKWEEIYFTAGSIGLAVEQKRDNEAGIYYNHKFSAKHPGENTDVTTWREIVRHELLIKLEYNTGDEKLIGNADNPVRIDESYKSGHTTGREVSFEWDGVEENVLIN